MQYLMLFPLLEILLLAHGNNTASLRDYRVDYIPLCISVCGGELQIRPPRLPHQCMSLSYIVDLVLENSTFHDPLNTLHEDSQMVTGKVQAILSKMEIGLEQFWVIILDCRIVCSVTLL